MSTRRSKKRSGRASPKKTMSGLTSPSHSGHRGIFLSATISFILSFGYFSSEQKLKLDGTCNLQSIHRLSAKLPCASTILWCTTPAIRSNVSIFCVKHLKSIDLSCKSRINVCVKVGLKAPGYKDCARI